MAKQSILDAIKKPDATEILKFLRGRGIRPSRAGDGREVATSGCSGLSAGERTAITTILQTRDRSEQAIAEAAKNEMPTDTLAAQIGRPLYHDEICKRLRALNPNFIFERSKSFPDIMGIYYPSAGAESGRKHIMGFEYGYSPEFTVRHPQRDGPKKITRGWREVILRLSKRGYINFTAACKAFDVTAGRDSKHWQTEVNHLVRAG
jgi:hypothetical protein